MGSTPSDRSGCPDFTWFVFLVVGQLHQSKGCFSPALLLCTSLLKRNFLMFFLTDRKASSVKKRGWVVSNFLHSSLFHVLYEVKWKHVWLCSLGVCLGLFLLCTFPPCSAPSEPFSLPPLQSFNHRFVFYDTRKQKCVSFEDSVAPGSEISRKHSRLNMKAR